MNVYLKNSQDRARQDRRRAKNDQQNAVKTGQELAYIPTRSSVLVFASGTVAAATSAALIAAGRSGRGGASN
jgi:uncharacterized membrane protein